MFDRIAFALVASIAAAVTLLGCITAALAISSLVMQMI